MRLYQCGYLTAEELDDIRESVKAKDYGTKAEQLAIKYAFEEMGMIAVNADIVKKNTRSQHVIEKAGFKFINEDEYFKYYRIQR